MTISVGLQAGFGSPLAAEFVGMASYGFRVVRQDLFAVDPQSVPALIAEFVGAPCRPLFLVGGGHIQVPDGSRRLEPTELAAMTTTVVQQAEAVGLVDYALEVGNEPDIAHPGYADHPEEFAEAVRTCRDAARAAGFAGMVVSGGIANLNDRGFRYLSRMIGSGKIPNDVAVGFHRYPEAGRGPLVPHDRFHSREDEYGWRWSISSTTGQAIPISTSTAYGARPASGNPSPRPYAQSTEDKMTTYVHPNWCAIYTQKSKPAT